MGRFHRCHYLGVLGIILSFVSYFKYDHVTDILMNCINVLSYIMRCIQISRKYFICGNFQVY